MSATGSPPACLSGPMVSIATRHGCAAGRSRHEPPALVRDGGRSGAVCRLFCRGRLAKAGATRSEERRVGQECVSVDLGCRRIIKKKKQKIYITTEHCMTINKRTRHRT